MADKQTCPDCGSINCVEFDVSREDETIQGRDCERWTHSFRCDHGHEFTTTEYRLQDNKLVEMLETAFNQLLSVTSGSVMYDRTNDREIAFADVAYALSRLIPERRQHYRDIADECADQHRTDCHEIPDSHFICTGCGDMFTVDRAVHISEDGEHYCWKCVPMENTLADLHALMSKWFLLEPNDYDENWFDLGRPLEPQAEYWSEKYDVPRVDHLL